MRTPPADVLLRSTGRMVAHTARAPDAWDAIPTTGPAELTEIEWQEYCSVIRQRAFDRTRTHRPQERNYA